MAPDPLAAKRRELAELMGAAKSCPSEVFERDISTLPEILIDDLMGFYAPRHVY